MVNLVYVQIGMNCEIKELANFQEYPISAKIRIVKNWFILNHHPYHPDNFHFLNELPDNGPLFFKHVFLHLP